MSESLIVNGNPADNQPKEEAPAILRSLQAVNDEIKAITKDQQGYNYKFRGIDKVMNLMGPLFKKHNIIVARNPLEIRQNVFEDAKGNKFNHATILVNYRFVSTIDASQIVSFGFGEGMDKGDKSIGCATSNAYKYVIFEMFNIPSEDQIDSDQKTAIENGVEEVQAPAKKVTKTEKKTAGFRKKKVTKKVTTDNDL